MTVLEIAKDQPDTFSFATVGSTKPIVRWGSGGP